MLLLDLHLEEYCISLVHTHEMHQQLFIKHGKHHNNCCEQCEEIIIMSPCMQSQSLQYGGFKTPFIVVSALALVPIIPSAFLIKTSGIKLTRHPVVLTF